MKQIATTPSALELLTTSLTTVKTDSLSALLVVAPIAVAILGAFLVWKFGIRFFKGLIK